ncbi:MAG: molybdopterin-dependent oxidoreductase [Candidatus Cloacimonetes bacterium]|nr:molybdopterin-dependent oxidoreductase [Candidatus Cloacimonadota bacterium]
MKYTGKPHIRLDGIPKTNGKAIYGNDLKLPNMLYAACKYADIVTGKINNIDSSLAQDMPGVKMIALYDDVPGAAKVGPIRQDYLPIVHDEVFFTGDVIAVVAAETREQAILAAGSIDVDYTPYKPLTDPQMAVLPSARLIHPEYKSNVVNHYPLRKGDIEAGFAAADQIITRTYKTGFQEHAYIEPETVTVEPDPHSGGYNIYGSIQNPYTTRKVAAMYLGIPLNRINVIPSVMGGSFGGKDDIINNMACRTALLCQMTGRPVQMTNSREVSLRESYKRHPYILTYKAGFTSDGKLTAMKIDILADSGAYSSQTFFVTWRSVVQATGPYEIPHVETSITSVYTNNCYTAAFRGFGSPQIIFAQESLMDEIAAICGLDPLELRLKNALRQNSITATGQKLNGHTVSLRQVLQTAAGTSDFLTKYQNNEELQETRYKKGIGLACSFRGCSLGAEGTDTSSAIVSVQADGSIILFTGVSENGQGLQTTMSLIAAEELGIPLKNIVFLPSHTSIIADGGPTVASRGTIAGGNAVKLAAEKIKNALFPLIKDELKTDNVNDLLWEDGRIIYADNSILFTDAVTKAVQAGINLSAYGWFQAPEVSWDEESGQGNAYFTYVYGCQVAEITVDSYTGKIEVDHIYAAHDLGRAINILGAQGQIFGGVAQGLGYALTEDFNISGGEVLSDNFDTYLIPTIQDVPQITPLIIENPDPAGPLGAKSLGEPTLELISAAINNAYFNATGKHSTEIPLSLEKVFLGHKLQKPQRQSQQNFEHKKFHHHHLDVETYTPRNLDEAMKILEKISFKVLAGGTDLVINLRDSGRKQFLLNIRDLSELKGISQNEDHIEIGGAETFSRIINDPLVQKHFPLLITACSQIGSHQIRNVATIAGNLVNAAPCADSAPPLILYEAKLLLRSTEETRTIPAADFIIKSYQTMIKHDEIVVAIQIPLPAAGKTFEHYYQLGRRKALNITRLSISARARFAENGIITEIRLAAGSLLSRPSRLSMLEKIITGRRINDELLREVTATARKCLEEEIGSRWSAAYKIPVFINLLHSALLDLQKQYSEYKND